MKRLSAVCACSTASMLLLTSFASPPTSPMQPDDKQDSNRWRMAVVFQWDKGRRIHIGVVQEPAAVRGADSTPQDGTRPTAAPRKPKSGEYEVWYLGDGVTEGYCFDLDEQRYRSIDKSGNCAGPDRLDGVLKSVVASAKPSSL